MKLGILSKDILIIVLMAILAGCGLIYQYLLSHYTGRILGVMEHAIFTMIGIMIVAMGLGAFCAKLVKCPFTAFAWLEILIALIGATALLMIGGSFVFAHEFPRILAENYNMSSDLIPRGTLVQFLDQFAKKTPYIFGFMIGFMIGMEIPFIARVREIIYGENLKHNVGTIYGADYIGAGAGAAIFVIYMLSTPIEKSITITAAANLVVGFIFLIFFYSKIRHAFALLILHILLGVFLIFLFLYGSNWQKTMEGMLYEDKIIIDENTKFQHLVVTKRSINNGEENIFNLYINGRTQFSSQDEVIYHSMLTYPPMMASARTDDILIIGGGDGLALRDILKWDVKNVTMLELDEEMISIFKNPQYKADKIINKPLLDLNKSSLSDERLNIIYGDAFNTIDKLINDRKKYDTIIVDLPDPSHPNLNKLYSVMFYKKIYELLNADGAVSIQSTSPYHAKKTFLTIGVTMKEAGFKNVERYQQNIPSFGQWGWTIATRAGKPASYRLKEVNDIPHEDESEWITKGIIDNSFEFGSSFFVTEKELEPNRVGTHIIYLLHQEEWMEDKTEF